MNKASDVIVVATTTAMNGVAMPTVLPTLECKSKILEVALYTLSLTSGLARERVSNLIPRMFEVALYNNYTGCHILTVVQGSSGKG